ncbi:hypothetical protein [Enterobacter sp. Lyrl_3]|uniref:hypothetical protein n=1 Tax=Enterobacter sp. Lyrl_3 TaxID=3110922 RepID=UPI003F814649
MKSYLSILERIIQQHSKGAVMIGSGGGNLELCIRAMTTLKEEYEPPVLSEIPEQHAAEFKRVVALDDSEQLIAFVEKYGVKLSDEHTKLWCAGMILQHQGQAALAQAMFDTVYAANLRGKMHTLFEPKLKEKYARAKLQENAKKARNRHSAQALKIAKATWRKYPGASLGQMCEKIRAYFNNEISIDTLKRGIKSAGIRPKSPNERKSFSLVIPPDA